MANTLLTHDMIADAALPELRNQLTFGAHVNKGFSSEFHAQGRFKKGSSVRIELPVKYRAKNAVAMDVVDMYETNTTVTVDVQSHVALNITMQDLLFKIEDFSTKHLVPATAALANQVDYTGLAETLKIYNLVGTAGTTPSTLTPIFDAMVRMNNEAVMNSPRIAVISPKCHGALANGEMKTFFSADMVEQLTRKGILGMFGGFEFYVDQNVRNMTCGTRAGTPLVKTQPSEGATTLAIKGLNAAETVVAGEVFTIATVCGVNPESGQAWEGNELRQFVVLANATADGAGDITVSVSPAIYSSAATETYLPYQTVNDIPAVNDAITWVGTLSTSYPQNIMFHPNCFALTMVPFQTPMSAGQSVKWGQSTDERMGLAISVMTGVDLANHAEDTRMDILYGWDTPRPELGVRMTG